MRWKSISYRLWIITAITAFLALALLSIPHKRLTFLLANGAGICIITPRPLATLRASTYTVYIHSKASGDGTVFLRGDIEHNPILVLSSADSEALYILYDCDVMLRLIKIDLNHKPRAFPANSVLNWIVSGSSFSVEQGDQGAWKALLSSLNAMDKEEFQRHLLPTLDVGFIKVYPRRSLLMPRMRSQITAMFDGNSTAYDYGQ